jgi:hypothetical protein
VCDDVRIEMSGKHILIGVYTTSIVFQQLPAQLSIHLWIDFQHERTGVVSFAVRGRLKPTDAVAFEFGGQAEVNKAGIREAMAAGPLPCLIGQEGSLVIEFKTDEGEWEEIRALPIQTAASVASEREQQSGQSRGAALD